jgi:trk system potassium uptake protein
VSARVARERYHVPRVIARIYDPRRADIYEQLDIPTVASVRWSVKQIMLMLSHAREEIKESLGGGDLFRMRIEVPSHLVGQPASSLSMPRKILVAGVDRGGQGFIPDGRSTFQEGDVTHLIVHQDALEELDRLLTPPVEE